MRRRLSSWSRFLGCSPALSISFYLPIMPSARDECWLRASKNDGRKETNRQKQAPSTHIANSASILLL
ncbi:hypothetical protein QQG55_39250 [Brugia pahangi]